MSAILDVYTLGWQGEEEKRKGSHAHTFPWDPKSEERRTKNEKRKTKTKTKTTPDSWLNKQGNPSKSWEKRTTAYSTPNHAQSAR
jgi:hypothetical protein